MRGNRLWSRRRGRSWWLLSWRLYLRLVCLCSATSLSLTRRRIVDLLRARRLWWRYILLWRGVLLRICDCWLRLHRWLLRLRWRIIHLRLLRRHGRLRWRTRHIVDRWLWLYRWLLRFWRRVIHLWLFRWCRRLWRRVLHRRGCISRRSVDRRLRARRWWRIGWRCRWRRCCWPRICHWRRLHRRHRARRGLLSCNRCEG